MIHQMIPPAALAALCHSNQCVQIWFVMRISPASPQPSRHKQSLQAAPANAATSPIYCCKFSIRRTTDDIIPLSHSPERLPFIDTAADANPSVRQNS
jgi:hypothetical protein